MQVQIKDPRFLQMIRQKARIPLGFYYNTCNHCQNSEQVHMAIHYHNQRYYIEGVYRCSRCGQQHRRVEEVTLESAYLAYIGATVGIA